MTRADGDLGQMCVGLDATIRQAMAAIDLGVAEIAFLIDGDGVLCGCVTDGDIRRALLGGRGIDDPVRDVATANPLTARPSDSRAAVLDVMHARRIAQVPVVDDRGALAGLHLLRDFVVPRRRPNVAFVLAGGRGSRLAPLTETLPKPMLNVAGRPILERLVLHLVGHGFRDIVLSLNYLGEVIEDHFGDGRDFGCRVRYVRERADVPLGTAGSLALLGEVVGDLTDAVLVVNGDLVTSADLGALVDHHEAAGSRCTLAVREHLYQVPFGVVGVDGATGSVTSVDEKPTARWLVSAGIAVVEPSVIAGIAPGTSLQLPQLVQQCIHRGDAVGAWHLEDDWIDVGRPAQLHRARFGSDGEHG